MKLLKATILVSVTAVAVLYQSDASVASRSNGTRQTTQSINSDVLVAVNPIVARLALQATSQQAVEISDELLSSTDMSKALQISSHPSKHFISAVYNHLERQGSNDAELLSLIARTPSTPLGILKQLATHHSEQVRVAVATNPAIGSDIAEDLLKNESRAIKLGLALNPTFARIAPSSAADLISQLSEQELKNTVGLDARHVSNLLERTNYRGLVERLLEERSDETSAKATAKRFVEKVEALQVG